MIFETQHRHSLLHHMFSSAPRGVEECLGSHPRGGVTCRLAGWLIWTGPIRTGPSLWAVCRLMPCDCPTMAVLQLACLPTWCSSRAGATVSFWPALNGTGYVLHAALACTHYLNHLVWLVVCLSAGLCSRVLNLLGVNTYFNKT